MGDYVAGSSGVISNRYRFLKALRLSAAILNSLVGFLSITKDRSVCSSISKGGGS